MSIMSSVKSAVYQSQTSSVVKPYSGGKESVAIKAGDFLLNGKKLAITKGDSLKSISEKINKLAPQTGVRARIVKKDDGYGLHLVSKNKPVGIQDPNGVLANLYSKGHIGKSSKHLIQVTGGEIFYNSPLPRSQQHSQALMDMFKVVKPHNTEPNPNRLVVLNEVNGAIEENLNPQEVALNDLSEALENNLFQLQNSPEADDAAGDISEIGNFDFDFSGEVSEDDGDQTVVTLSDDELELEEELQPQPPPQLPLAQIQAQIQANMQEAVIQANGLVFSALTKVVVSNNLIHTNLMLPENKSVCHALTMALASKFNAAQLETNAAPGGQSFFQMLVDDLNNSRNGSYWNKKFTISENAVVNIANRIKHNW